MAEIYERSWHIYTHIYRGGKPGWERVLGAGEE